MKIEPFRADDIAPFLKLAAAEGWVAERWEFEFLLAEFSQGCFTARGENGEAAGFVTSLLHGRSSWIGNLIVAEPFRGKGVGGALFRNALGGLQSAGVDTIWLTASEAGAPLYARHGFTSIDTMVRWVGSGRGEGGQDSQGGRDSISSPVSVLDCLAWGDQRAALLAATVGRGRLLQEDSGFAVIQANGEAWQLGPFTAVDSAAAERLLDRVLNAVPHRTGIFLDSPASNRAALRMFNRNRLNISGTSELMYAGVRPDYRPEWIYGLATMGSCG